MGIKSMFRGPDRFELFLTAINEANRPQIMSYIAMFLPDTNRNILRASMWDRGHAWYAIS